MPSKRKITKFTLRINTVKYIKNLLLYINITDQNLIYISWPTGRTYFKVKKKDYKKYVKNIAFNDSTNTLTFTYIGPAKTQLFGTGKTKKVIKKYTFKFELAKDYRYIKNLLK